MPNIILEELRAIEDDTSARLADVRERLTVQNALTRELPELEKRRDDLRGMPYRSEDLADLERKLELARGARTLRAQLRIAEADLLMEKERVRLRLEDNGIRKVTLPMLETVQVATPCPASWADMQGDSDVRFCKECSKNVYNLSMMAREEAEAVLRTGNGNICIRLYRRSDGTVLTQDCPVGVKHQRFWRRATGIAAGGLLAAALGIAYEQYIAKEACVAQATAGGLGSD